METVKILDVRDETPTIKTYTLDLRMDAKPGQFAMLWVPGVGEKPFGFSRIEGNIEFTVRRVGSFTEKLFKLKKGDWVGVRGPYGDGCFKLEGKKLCIAGGGAGFAPMRPLIDEALKQKKEVIVIQGASNVKELMWLDELKEKNLKLLLATDDGTCGSRGSVCDALHSVLDDGVDQICACGPEVMLKIIADMASEKKIPCLVSLERYMKCATGLCGQCCIDPSGDRVCKEGPVFSAEKLKGSEFGRYRRDSSGSKHDI